MPRRGGMVLIYQMIEIGLTYDVKTVISISAGKGSPPRRG
jgi:hypothetical protein